MTAPGQSHLAKGRGFAATDMLRPRSARATNGPNAITLGYGNLGVVVGWQSQGGALR